jgi:hypothetical protein
MYQANVFAEQSRKVSPEVNPFVSWDETAMYASARKHEDDAHEQLVPGTRDNFNTINLGKYVSLSSN